MTDMRHCTVSDGRIIVANNNRLVTIGGHKAIICHNNWSDIMDGGEQHQVGLDFQSDPSTGNGDASVECAEIIQRLFPEYT